MKNLFSLILFCCLIFNYSAKATGNGDVFYFDFNTNLSASEMISAPVSEVPTSTVIIYFPRTEGLSGKDKSFVKSGRKYSNWIFQNSYFSFLAYAPPANFKTPIYLLKKVFLI